MFGSLEAARAALVATGTRQQAAGTLRAADRELVCRRQRQPASSRIRRSSIRTTTGGSGHLMLSAALMIAPVLVGGCEQKPGTTMDLLRAGNASVCTASDVEDTLRTLIRPKEASTDGYTISFADASLERFDSVVSRATCNAALTVDGPNGSVIERTMIDYVVAPAAQDPSSFIVSGTTGSFTERLAEAISNDEANQGRQDRVRQEEEALAALVKPGWLNGRWVPQAQGSQACAAGPYDEYRRSGRYADGTGLGTWRLSGQDLTVVLPAASVSFTITEASMDEFTMQDANGDDRAYRRCSASDIQAPPEAPVATPVPNEAEPEPTAEPTPSQP